MHQKLQQYTITYYSNFGNFVKNIISKDYANFQGHIKCLKFFMDEVENICWNSSIYKNLQQLLDKLKDLQL